MRKLKLVEHISLDGVIQVGSDEDGNFRYGDWTAPYRSPAGLAIVLAEYGESFDLLLGRRNYDLWAGFWPKAPKSPMADRLIRSDIGLKSLPPNAQDRRPAQRVQSIALFKDAVRAADDRVSALVA
jgi:hypothetical protein